MHFYGSQVFLLKNASSVVVKYRYLFAKSYPCAQRRMGVLNVPIFLNIAIEIRCEICYFEKLLISVVHHTLVLTSIRTNVTREMIIITCAYSTDQCTRPLNGPTRFNELPFKTGVYRKKNKTKQSTS